MFAQDLADVGVNVWDRTLMRAMPGAWLRQHIDGLFTRPPMGYRWVPVKGDSKREQLTPIWPNRAQERFVAPRWQQDSA